MIKTSFTDQRGVRHYVFGLSEQNVQRLLADDPIRVNLADVGGEGTVFIFAGESENQMEAMMRTHGLIGPETRIVRSDRP